MRKLTLKETKPGMILAAQVIPPVGQPLAAAGSEITPQLITQMEANHVEYVLIAEKNTPAKVPETLPPVREKNSQLAMQKANSAKFHDFEMQYYMAMEKLKIVFNDIISQQTKIDTTDLLENVSVLFRSRNTIIELFEMLYKMRSINDSVYAHSINVALISRMIGRWLKMDKDYLDTLTVAGLLHDIGKLMIPEEILNKPDSLTDEEFEIIKSHPRKGYDILKNLDINPRIKKSALMHHERSDGSGYPSGLTDEFIDEYAMIIAIADVYDAMTAARAYRSPLCPFEVIANFEKDGYQKYHTKYILTFLKQIAATYQNSRVILSDGRGCRIVMQNQNNLSRPVVQFDDNSCLDLSHESRNLYIQKVL